MPIDFAEKLYKRKYQNRNSVLCRRSLRRFPDLLLEMLFPQWGNRAFESAADLRTELNEAKAELAEVLDCLKNSGLKIPAKDKVITDFFSELAELEEKLTKDAEFIHREDPASASVDEVILCYPGFYAIAVYRIAHWLHRLKVPLFPRVLTEYAHERTGIDIHPGASIDAPFFIDHGTGIVIGETTVIGARVKLFQGVTLGALSVAPNLRKKKRHPTIEEDCLIYANTTILGGETRIGKHSVIGGNVWLTESVPPKSRIFYLGELTRDTKRLPSRKKAT